MTITELCEQGFPYSQVDLLLCFVLDFMVFIEEVRQNYESASYANIYILSLENEQGFPISLTMKNILNNE